MLKAKHFVKACHAAALGYERSTPKSIPLGP